MNQLFYNIFNPMEFFFSSKRKLVYMEVCVYNDMARAQHRELRSLLFARSALVL